MPLRVNWGRPVLLNQRKARRRARVYAFLRDRVWPLLPERFRGRPLTKQEREQILGYGPEGF